MKLISLIMPLDANFPNPSQIKITIVTRPLSKTPAREPIITKPIPQITSSTLLSTINVSHYYKY